MNRTCFCAAYRFPHRMGSGKCEAHRGDPLCEACGHPANAMRMDYGVGSYEYGSIRGFHRDVRAVSDCCEAGLIENSASKKEWFEAVEPFEA